VLWANGQSVNARSALSALLLDRERTVDRPRESLLAANRAHRLGRIGSEPLSALPAPGPTRVLKIGEIRSSSRSSRSSTCGMCRPRKSLFILQFHGLVDLLRRRLYLAGPTRVISGR